MIPQQLINSLDVCHFAFQDAPVGFQDFTSRKCQDLPDEYEHSRSHGEYT
jgi:hypothetical protein